MSYFDQMWRDVTGIDELPTQDWVLPVIHGRNTGMFCYGIFEEGYFVQGGWAETEEQAWARIAARHESTRASWQAKIAWKLAGDRANAHMPALNTQQEAVVYAGGSVPARTAATGPRNVLRAGHHHYTVHRFGVDKTSGPKGFGGRVFRWRFLDDPTGAVYESNDVYSQGDIPQEFWPELPDNVEWVDGQYAVPVRMEP